MESNAAPNAAKPKRRWYQFSLRTLLIFVTLAGCGFGWLGLKAREARKQHAAVTVVDRTGGHVVYDYEVDAQGNYLSRPVPPGPAWLHALLGDDWFRNVRRVSYGILNVNRSRTLADGDLELFMVFTKLELLNLNGAQVTDTGVAHLKGLVQLRELSLERTQITDAGLEHLTGLTQLESLDLLGTQVTDAGLACLNGLTHLKSLSLVEVNVTGMGVAKLQRALPNCKIER